MSKLVLKTEVDNTDLNKGLNQVQNKTKKTLNSVSDGIQGASGGVKGILGLFKKMGPVGKAVAVSIGAIGAAIGSAIALVNRLANKMDDVAKSAKSVNMTTKAFQQLQYAAGLSGVGMDKIMAIITTLSQRLIQAEQGVKNVVEGFTDLGLSWSELQKMSPQQQIIEVIAAAQKITDISKRNKILFKLFQKEDIRSLNKLVDADFGRAVANAKNMGIVIDEESIRIAEAYNDSLSTANKRIIAMASNLKATKQAMKIIAEMANKLTQSVSSSDGKVGEQYKNYYVGIGDEAEKIYNNIKKTSPKTFKHIRSEIDKLKKEFMQDFIHPESGIKVPGMKQADAERLAYQKVMFKYASYSDTRFDANDKNTWVQKRKVPLTSPARDPEKIKEDKIRSAIARTIGQLDKKAKKHQQNYQALDKILTVEKYIAKIQQESGGKLNQNQRSIISEAYYQYRLKRDREIFQEIKNQNKALIEQHQIQKAIIEGDRKRVQVLKAMQRLRGKGIEASQSDFANADANYKKAESDADVAQLNKSSFKGIKDRNEAAKELIALLNKQIKDNDQQRAGALKKLSSTGDEQTAIEIAALLDVLAKQRKELLSKLANAEKAAKETQAGAKEYDKWAEKLKGLLLKRNNAKIIKDVADQLKEAQKRQTDLDIRNIEKIGQGYNKKVQLQIARLDEDTNYVRQLQTINELISKGIISNEKDLQRVRAEYEKLLKLKKSADEDVQVAKVKKMTRDTQGQNQISRAIYNYDLDRANTLRLINELKSQGIKVDQKELKNNKAKYQALLNQRKIQRQMNLKQSQRDQGNDLVLQAMKLAGLEKQANRLQAKRNAEKIKGGSLTKQQLDKVNLLADLQTKLADYQYNFDGNLDIKTNEMTARGGFAKGAVMPDKSDVNNQIRDAAKQSNRILTDIRSLLQNGGII